MRQVEAVFRACAAGRWLELPVPDWSTPCEVAASEPISVNAVTLFLCPDHARFVDQLPFRGCCQ